MMNNYSKFYFLKKFNIIGKEITITVTTSNGQLANNLRVSSSINVNELMKKIEDLTGESMKNKILMSGSTELIENKSLEQYNIEDGANLKTIEKANKGNVLIVHQDQRFGYFYN